VIETSRLKILLRVMNVEWSKIRKPEFPVSPVINRKTIDLAITFLLWLFDNSSINFNRTLPEHLVNNTVKVYRGVIMK